MIIFVLLLAFGLRLISLNQSFWIDEATSALTTQMPLSDFFNKFMTGDFHPPLYYLTLKTWSMLFGTSEIALRSLSVIFAVGTIYIVYLIGKNLVDKKVGVIASVLLATSGLHIYYSQEARMYSMSTFLVTLSVYLFIKVFHTKTKIGSWLLFSLIICLIGLTDYLPILILPVFWIVAIFSKKPTNWWFKFIASHIILVLVSLLWFPLFFVQFTSGVNVTNTSPAWVQVLGKFSLKEILLIPVKFEIGRISLMNKYLYGSVVGLVTIVFSYLFYKAFKMFSQIKIIWMWLIVPIGIAIVISTKIPVLNYFRFLFVLPAFCLLAASGINTLKQRPKIIILFLIISVNLITSCIYLTNAKFQREDWRNAVNFIESTRGESSAVVFPTLSQMEAYKYYNKNVTLYDGNNFSANSSEIWLIRYASAISDPSDSTRKKIEELNYEKIREFDFNGVTVWQYFKL